jgi:hypothetical protein
VVVLELLLLLLHQQRPPPHVLLESVYFHAVAVLSRQSRADDALR